MLRAHTAAYKAIKALPGVCVCVSAPIACLYTADDINSMLQHVHYGACGQLLVPLNVVVDVDEADVCAKFSVCFTIDVRMYQMQDARSSLPLPLPHPPL